ncbi:MAG: hypothetical protein K0R41_1737 [Geminicoccaceae bacterium]|jgi:uncharacterized protein (TIGR03032 family)|nr:hypothetical protein [Geminicoccaceae bacterium]MCE3247912.1 hypothetical protein [Geminicoccaceae bacterium]MDF2780234.1 hypothetical protein [Geminicoccaceae bacterium]
MSSTAGGLDASSTSPTAALELTASRQFTTWLAEQRISLAFTTYQAGKLFLLGLQTDGRLSIFNRTFERCMGIWASPERLLMGTLYQLWRFDNALPPGQAHKGHDRLYVPQLAWTTGDLDVHDIAVDRSGRPVFVNTLFSCLATVSETHSFKPIWRPPFVSKLAAEDRCHLNGLAMDVGEPRYTTSVSTSDVADGWRDHRMAGGVVIDVASGEVVATGLSMPHSPRLHQGRLYLLDSGSGRFGWVEPHSGRFEEICFCPGYARGLALMGEFAVVGLSLPRHNPSFSGLPLDGQLSRRCAVPRCGLLVIDLRTGDAVHSLRLEGAIHELYDVAAMPGVVRPMALGFRSDEIRRLITIAPDGR